MKLRINKHSKPLQWFVLDFINYYNSNLLIEFIKERFPEAKVELGAYYDCPQFMGRQPVIKFKTLVDADAFNFFIISNNNCIELGSQ
jgi:hypothetical protein